MFTGLIASSKSIFPNISQKSVVAPSAANGSIVLILGLLVIGFVASAEQADGIAPFASDIFKGFLSVFLLDMGLTSLEDLSAMEIKRLYLFAFSVTMLILDAKSGLYLSMALGITFLINVIIGMRVYYSIFQIMI